MPKNPRSGQCVYCGIHGTVTRDHVPPKCLFPLDARVNLPTVPACHKCNSGFKLDDEYFRVILSLRADLPEGPETDFLREKTTQTLRDPAAKGFRDYIRAAKTNIPTHSNSGIYLGEAGALKVNPARITKTALRIVRGLYAKNFGQLLPCSHEVAVTIIDFQRDSTALNSPETIEILSLVRKHGAHMSFGPTLDIWYLKADDDPESSVWWINLHKTFGFLGFTTPRIA